MSEQIYPALVRGIWISTRDSNPFNDGWYLVVVEGYGKRYQKVDWYEVDDVQWASERKDPAVSVTHFRVLPDLPPV